MDINYDLSKILNRSHEGKWVALSPDRHTLLGVSDKLTELTKIIHDKDALYMKVLPSDVSFAFKIFQ